MFEIERLYAMTENDGLVRVDAIRVSNLPAVINGTRLGYDYSNPVPLEFTCIQPPTKEEDAKNREWVNGL